MSDYYERVTDQRVETFIQCHINAFNYFGGVPEYIKIDNLKAAILEANFYEPIYQELYKNLAEYYKFKPMPCRVRKPNDKGKVEAGIKYFKGNFILGRKFRSKADFDNQLKNWLENTCNARIHGTIRKVPNEVFQELEKSKLIPLPAQDFKIPEVGTRKVYCDCHIYVGYNYYSVPFEYVGKDVDVEISKNFLRVSYQGKNIAIHKKLEGRGEFSTVRSHYPKYKMYSETEYQEKYQVKMAEIGSYAEQLFFIVIRKYPGEWLKKIQGILSLQKKFPKEVIDLSCKRAIAYNALQYRIIKNICEKGTYNLPVEFNFEENNYEYVKK